MVTQQLTHACRTNCLSSLFSDCLTLTHTFMHTCMNCNVCMSPSLLLFHPCPSKWGQFYQMEYFSRIICSLKWKKIRGQRMYSKIKRPTLCMGRDRLSPPKSVFCQLSKSHLKNIREIISTACSFSFGRQSGLLQTSVGSDPPFNCMVPTQRTSALFALISHCRLPAAKGTPAETLGL